MRSLPKLRRAAILFGAALLPLAGFAHVRLMNPGNGNPLFWNDPTNVGIVISSVGSDNIADRSEDTALRNAIDAWNDSPGQTARLVEDTSAEERARTDWDSNSIHMILFDEDNSSGYFPGGSSTVAITPIWFYSTGLIDDADILFNGKTFSFTTRGQAGRFDVQDVATHELGHLLGLDHSGWAGATMYPFVDSTVILHRSLSGDDVNGMRGIYPSGSFATISGTVKRSLDDSPVAGAHVVVRDSGGRTAGATLAAANGTFLIEGLDAGSYELYATPLDHPVSASNLGSGWVVETDFESTVHGTVAVTAGGTTAIGDFLVGDDVSVSLGRNSDRYPLRCQTGTTGALLVRGTGLVDGSTLSASDPDLVVTPISWFGTQVSFSVNVPSLEAAGHSDLIITDPSGDQSILVAALEITPPDPVVTTVSPNQADIGGGTAVTLVGSEFRAGARVVFGGQIYEDGAPGGCTVVSSTSITLTTVPSSAGITDVVVIDSSGVEGRKVDGFQFLAVPQIATVFPPAGDAAGGTQVTLRGGNFAEGVVVRIAGVTQSQVQVVSSTKLLVTTTGGSTGGPYVLEVENPGGSSASSQFSYSSLPDPVLGSITPAQGSVAGGEVVTLTGSNFTTGTQVFFGADPETGTGGSAASLAVVQSASTIEVTTPSSSSGSTAVLIRDPVTGQADVIDEAFTFVGGGGGGGGGCHTIPVQGPPDPRDIAWTLLLLAFVVVGLRLQRRASIPRRLGAG